MQIEYRQNNPISAFLYALKAPESRRQFPRRLKMLFDFIGLPEPLENQAVEFVKRGKEDAGLRIGRFGSNSI